MKEKLLGVKLKQLREHNGLVQRQVATLLEIDTPMYSKLERGERLPKVGQLSQLADLFNVKEKDLRILWLAEKILKTIHNEDEINMEAVNLVQSQLSREKNSSFQNDLKKF